MWEYIAAAGLAAGGAILGQLLANQPREEQMKILESVRDEYGRIDPARVQKLAAERLGPSALSSIQPDAQYDTAQRDSLARMDNEVNAHGMGLQDRASLNDALDRSGRQDRGQRSAIEQQFDARGAGGSSQALLAQLVNQQGSAQRAQGAGLDAAGQAQQRYWQAIRDRAAMAREGGQDAYNRKARAAEAQDAINRWNATNEQDTARYNNSLEQQRFENDMQRAAGKGSTAGAVANAYGQQADRTAQAGANIGSAAGKAVSQYGADQQAEEDAEKRRKTYAV